MQQEHVKAHFSPEWVFTDFFFLRWPSVPSHSRPQLPSISEHRIPSLPSMKDTNLLTVAPALLYLSVCDGQICANLPVASVFSLFLPPPSLCRFTLTYRELILLFLSFNKLLFKRWDPPPAEAHTNTLLHKGFPPAFRQTLFVWKWNTLGKTS